MKKLSYITEGGGAIAPAASPISKILNCFIYAGPFIYVKITIRVAQERKEIKLL